MNTTTVPIEYDKYFHIYNRGINSCDLFKSKNDFEAFQKKYIEYVSKIAETYAYCFMRNHFHFFVKIKAESEIAFIENKDGDLRVFDKPKRYNPSRQLSHFFDSYAKSFNSKYNRTGKLFETPFRRKIVESESYMKYLIRYIHNNPVASHIVDDFTKYKWSSASAIICEDEEIVCAKKCIAVYGEISDFINFHNNAISNEGFPEPEW
jgi:REP element-mobilizing transposase RayT